MVKLRTGNTYNNCKGDTSMNTDFKNVKAILFDSGHTLNKPKTGHWFFTPNFFNIIDKKSFNPSKLRLAYAMHKANKYMDDS